MNVKWECNYYFSCISLIILLNPTLVLSIPKPRGSLLFRSVKDDNPIVFDEYIESLPIVYRRPRLPPSLEAGGILFPTEEPEEYQRRIPRPTTKPDSVLYSYPDSSQMGSSIGKYSPNYSSSKNKNDKDQLLEEQIDKFIKWAKTKGLADNFVEASPPPVGKTNYFHLTGGSYLECPENFRKTSSDDCEPEIEFER